MNVLNSNQESDGDNSLEALTVKYKDFPLYDDIITSESDIPEEEKYVSFSVGEHKAENIHNNKDKEEEIYNKFTDGPVLELSYGIIYPKMRRAKIADVPVSSKEE